MKNFIFGVVVEMLFVVIFLWSRAEQINRPDEVRENVGQIAVLTVYALLAVGVVWMTVRRASK